MILHILSATLCFQNLFRFFKVSCMTNIFSLSTIMSSEIASCYFSKFECLPTENLYIFLVVCVLYPLSHFGVQEESAARVIECLLFTHLMYNTKLSLNSVWWFHYLYCKQLSPVMIISVNEFICILWRLPSDEDGGMIMF